MEVGREKLEKVAIIIPARGFCRDFKKCLASLLALDYSNYEVIVIDDGLSREGAAALSSFTDKIKVFPGGQRGPSYGRNLAAKNTDARFVAFTDSDCVVDNNWLKELMRVFSKYPDAAACGGRQLLPPDATKFEKKVYLFMKKAGFITDYMNKRAEEIIEVNHNPSCNVMYKRDIFLKEGGFLEGLWPGEDVELDYRLKKKGYKILFNPRSVVSHYKPEKLKDFLKMMFRYGEAQGFLVRKYGIFRKIHFIPFLNMAVIFFVIYGIKSFSYLLLSVLLLLFCFLRLEFFSFLFWNIGFWKGFQLGEKDYSYTKLSFMILLCYEIR